MQKPSKCYVNTWKTKVCFTCKKRKSVKNFYRRTFIKKDGYDSNCKKCKDSHRNPEKEKIRMRKAYSAYKERIRNTFIKRMYGITLEQYKEILISQKYKCKICKKKCPTGKALAIDHSHSTGKIRGLLCWRCNMGIGQFNDNVKLLVAAARYLRYNS